MGAAAMTKHVHAELMAEYADKYRYSNGFLVLKQASGNKKAGSIVGSPNSRGYMHTTFNGRLEKVHRIIFLMHHGYLPKVVDHIDGNVANNKICNLRDASLSENQWNAKTRTDNHSGEKGVYWSPNESKWKAAVQANNKRHHVGTFSSKAEAVLAVRNKRNDLHKEFTRHA